MKLESNDPTPGEPDDGWQKAPDLETNEILSITLCKYSGFVIEDLEGPCPFADTHAPEQCFTLYHSASALLRGEVDVAQYPPDVLITMVRADGGGDPNARVSG